jgi:carboxypeptidase Taq
MGSSKADYDELHRLSRQFHLLDGVSQILHWDQETYMPQGAGNFRGEQLEALAGLTHRQRTSPEFRKALDKLIDIDTGTIKAKGLSPAQLAALKYWRRDYRHATALPVEFVEEFAKLTSKALLVWQEAKAENSFQRFAPYLDKIVIMSRQKADLLGYKEHPYDALLDQFEPDTTHKMISELFQDLNKTLSPFVKAISKASQIDDSVLKGKFNTKKQLKFSHTILEMLGYGKEHGRLDQSAHPFSTSPHPSDSRITTRLSRENLHGCVLTVLHELGHAFYSMGLPQDQYGSPLGEAISHGIHESQSRWWETRIGLSKPFWEHVLPLLKKEFSSLETMPLNKFYAAINRVTPSFIRVEADEVTYPLHVILRTELESALIDGSLGIRDLPDAWRAGMKRLIGVTPTTDKEGCLQDIHWSMGAFGYFPSYLLGNIYATQLFESFEKVHSDWPKRIASGDFNFMKTWLHDNVHQYGRQYSAQELLKMLTKSDISAKPYIHYLKNKYSELYKLK